MITNSIAMQNQTTGESHSYDPGYKSNSSLSFDMVRRKAISILTDHSRHHALFEQHECAFVRDFIPSTTPFFPMPIVMALTVLSRSDINIVCTVTG
jgi:hypothetical protein